MTAVARQLAATPLGAGRWRVELGFKVTPGTERPPRPHPRQVALRGDPSGAEIESLRIARPSRPDHFSVVIAVPDAAPPLFQLVGPEWTAEIELPQPGPKVAADLSRPAAIDYTARDFAALRTMLFAVIDEAAGQSLADHAVSETAALVEELAYLGDALSYSQDGVATEAYLASARRRISVRRHAELLDYELGPAISARAWVRVTVTDALTLPAGTRLLAEAGDLPAQIDATALPAALAAQALVFETLAPVALQPDPPALQLAREVHGTPPRLAPGATSATVAGTAAGLAAGTLVLIEPADPLAIPAGQVVRLTAVARHGANTILTWGQTDALAANAALTQVDLELLPGNLVLADHGLSSGWKDLPTPEPSRRYWPALPAPNPAYTAGAATAAPSAADALAATGIAVQAAVAVRSGAPEQWRSWFVRDSLLESGPTDPGFVVEVEDDGSARLRFGDGTNGMQPPAGAGFQASARSGGGVAGNVAVGAIAHLVGPQPFVTRVHNPMPAIGGTDPEPLATVRLNAPTSFRITDRAVSADDYIREALAVDGVADAETVIVPTGIGPLAKVRIFAGDWTTPVAPLVAHVTEALDRHRPVGVALDVAGATAMPVTIALAITVEPGWALAAMSQRVEQTLTAHLGGPAQFGFATTLYRSEVIAWIVALPGVTDVTLTHFRRTGDLPNGRREQLNAGFGRIIRIDDDPTAPQLGSVSFTLSQGQT